jgi:hypothetical protein
MSTYVAAGPKRPKKKPKPKSIALAGGDYAFIDGDSAFEEGVEIFVCTNEETNEFELLETGNYSLLNGDSFEVVDGVVTTIY